MGKSLSFELDCLSVTSTCSLIELVSLYSSQSRCIRASLVVIELVSIVFQLVLIVIALVSNMH